MSSKLREALEKFNAVDLSGLEFPLEGDSSTIYNSNKKEITIPYWRVADLLNEVKAAQDMAKSAISAPPRNCDVGSAEEQAERFRKFCEAHKPDEHQFTEHGELLCPSTGCELIACNYGQCALAWAQMPYEGGEVDEHHRLGAAAI